MRESVACTGAEAYYGDHVFGEGSDAFGATCAQLVPKGVGSAAAGAEIGAGKSV